MIAVSSLPLFVECPRAFYFRETIPAPKKNRKKKNTPSGARKNSRHTIRQILPPTTSKMLKSEWLGLRGQCKFIEERGIKYPVVFRKSATIKPNAEDILKLSCYSLLIDNCPEGRVINPSTGAVFSAKITKHMRAGAKNIVDAAKGVLAFDYPPDARKGEHCSTCSYRYRCNNYADSTPPELSANDWLVPENEEGDEPGADKLPLYIQEQGAKIGITGDSFVVSKNGDKLSSVVVDDVSQIVIYGNIQISSQAMRKSFEKGIQILFFTGQGKFYGIAKGLSSYNSRIRPAQFQALTDTIKVEHISRKVVEAKIFNCRVFLMRNAGTSEATDTMKIILRKLKESSDIDKLRGFEGAAARLYFSKMDTLLKTKAKENGFSFIRRNRRPPKDPLNALLSFGYSMLVKEFTIVIESMGLDPMHGFYHASRSMRPALALDLMEPFRPLIADSTAIYTLNRGILSKEDFVYKNGGCYLTNNSRKTYIKQYEKRLNTKINYNNTTTLSYRNAIRKSVFDLKSYLLKTQPEFQPLKVK